MPEFGFIGPTYESRSLRVDAQRTVNLYPEVDESGAGQTRMSFYGTPGLQTFSTLPTSPVRGLWSGENRLFAVAGSKLYEVFSDGSSNLRGDVGDDATHTPAQIFPNGNQILIISAGLAYYDNGAGPVGCTFTLSGDPVAAGTGCFLDGYGIVHGPFSKQFFLSGLNDFTSWDELDVQTQEAYPDNIYSILADHRELWTFGDQTIEVYRNEGDADVVFRTDPGAFIDMGIQAAWSATKLPTVGPAWIGGDYRGRPVAYRMSGFTPTRLSTHGVEQAWSEYSDISDAIGWVEQWQGHTWLVFTFPTGNATWVYDVSTNMWHERASGPSLDRHRGRCHAYVWAKHFVGDHSTGEIHEMSMDFKTDNSLDITRMRTAPHIAKDRDRIFYNRLDLDIEGGEITGPVFNLEISDDGGRTFRAPVSTTAVGTETYEQTVRWSRLGSARSRVFRVTSTEAMRHAWVSAYLDATGGQH